MVVTFLYAGKSKQVEQMHTRVGLVTEFENDLIGDPQIGGHLKRLGIQGTTIY